MLRLHDLVDHAGRVVPEREAVVFGAWRKNYAELADRSRRVAAVLSERNVVHGDRVAFWAPNRAEFVEFLFGASRVGAIAVPLDHWLTPEGAVRAIERCRPSALIVPASRAIELSALVDRLRAAGVGALLALDDGVDEPWSAYEGAVTAAAPMAREVAVLPDDDALLLFTSGTTGSPKGAVHTHRDLVHTAAVMALELGLQEGERTLHFLPLFSSCLEHLLPLTYVRGSHIIMEQFDPAAVWAHITAERVTHIDAVPTTLTRLMEVAPAVCPESLRLVSYASEPMPSPLIRRLVAFAPRTSFVQFYGMIEHLCLTTLGADEQLSRVGTVGRPMLGARVRIVGPDGDDVPEGETGEVVAASPTLMRGYWEDPAATAKVMADGWMHTGDLGHVDAHGCLVLDGRIKEVIKSGGLTVVPRETEDALREHADVVEAAVVGVPSDRWGEEVQAFVVLRPGASVDADQLLEHCHRLMASYKCPKRIHFRTDLPRTGIGKISRRQLVESLDPTPT